MREVSAMRARTHAAFGSEPGCRTNTRLIRQIGCYDDKCVEIDGRWLIKHKFIDLWNGETPPPVRL
jgi:hypothetical protein